MKNIIVGMIIIFLCISIFELFQIGTPTIYGAINHDKSQLLEVIENLKNTTRFERTIALSDSPIAIIIKQGSKKIRDIHKNYYFLVDYCIDHYKKEKMSMSEQERKTFKKNKNTWKVLQSASFSYNWGVSQDYRIAELERIEKGILGN